MRFASQVVFVGRPVKEYFERFATFKRPPRLITNGVDHDVYHPVMPHVSIGPLRCLFVGRFVEKKGLALLKHCVDLPGLHWTFVGWGPLSPRSWAPLPERVEVYENLRGQEVVPHYQSADLLVLPSSGEGFPLVVQEALACGTPVLVSVEVAAALPMADSQCIFSVDLSGKDAASALRDRIRYLERDRALVTGAREKAVALSRQWSWDTCIDQYWEIYQVVRGVPHERRPSV